MERRALAVVVVALASATAHAHHSVLAYDGETPATITGTVVKVLWQNPHAYIDLDVAANGTHARWTVESEGPVALVRLGWTKTPLMPRDVIPSPGARARDGSARMRCATITLADARRLPCFPSGGA